MEEHNPCSTETPAGNKASFRKTSLSGQESHVPSSEVLEAIENVIQGVFQSLAQKKAPVLTVANRSDWRNIEYKDSVGLQMITGCTTKQIRSDCPQSAKRFEKDATFQRLLDDDFFNKVSPCIMITGRGIPDLNTRLLVRKLWDSFQIPIFTLMDADPHGSFQTVQIEKGSPFRFVSALEEEQRLEGPWEEETLMLEIMAASKLKAEIQVLTSLSSDYLSRVYLPNKLQFGGWL
ncbi:hypothetical protein TURU_162874 [Turdus rufiventris]|nr:hypothetical protein TURU_162874 [Turdus rufiventris]